MASIVTSLQDPNWWFTVVFIGILASVLGSYLSDIISSVLSRFSGYVKVRRDARLAKENERIALLVANPSLLTMEMIRRVKEIMLFLFTTVLYLSMPSFIEAVSHFKILSALNLMPSSNLDFFTLLLTLPMGVLSVLTGYHATSRISLTNRARHAYENKCKNKTQ